MPQETIMRDAAGFFHAQLRQNSKAQPAIEQLHKWGIRGRIIVQLGIGFHDETEYSFIDYMTRFRNSTVNDLAQAHLIMKSKFGSYCDRMRNSIIVPTIDRSGNVCCFDYYALDEKRWCLYPSGRSFRRSHELYSLNAAMRSKKKSVVVVSSYEDYFLLFGLGITNVVSSYFPQITKEQLGLLKNQFKVIMPFVPAASDFSLCGRFCRENKLFNDQISLCGCETPGEYIKKHGVDGLLQKIEEYESIG